MKRQVFSLLSVLAITGLNSVAARAASDDCVRDYRGLRGRVHSFASLFYPESQTMCNVYVAPQNDQGAGYSYDFQAGGLVSIAKVSGPADLATEPGKAGDSSSPPKEVHSYQIISVSDRLMNQFNREPSQAQVMPVMQVAQGSLNWRFTEKDFSLSGITHAESGRSCLSEGSHGAAAFDLVSGQSIDLNSCSDILAVDLGSSSTRQSIPLLRAKWVSVRGVVGGTPRSCEIQIGELYDYQVGESKITKASDNIVVDPVADPCFRGAVQQFSGLPFARAIEEFVKANPTHACVTATKRNYTDSVAAVVASGKSYRSLPKGLTALSPDQDISYQIKPLAEVRLALLRGKGDGCRLLAAKVDPSSGGASGTGSGATVR